LTPQQNHVDYYDHPQTIWEWVSNLLTSACDGVKELACICCRPHGREGATKKLAVLEKSMLLHFFTLVEADDDLME